MSGIEWSALSNPALSYPEWSIKDFACARHGSFYVFFSAFYHDDGRVRSHLVEVRTPDFREYSDPILHDAGREDGWLGLCSPDVVSHDGRYYLTHNSWGDKAGKPNQLFYRVSTDLEDWSERRPLAGGLTAGERAIDAAVTFAGGRCYLAFKDPEHRTRVAVAPGIDGPFESVGADGIARFERRDGGAVEGGQENYQFHAIDGERRLLTTDFHAGHRPTLYRLDGDPAEAGNWRRWTDSHRLAVPEQSFNTGDRANAAALYDWREDDGHFYLLYAGNAEGRYDGDTEGPFAGRGWNRLGLARSTDLETWTPAG